MISNAAALARAKQLTGLNFFPSDELGQIAIGELIAEICSTDDQAEWLVKKMLRTYNSWPGPVEMRACFCTKFRPADGFECGSTVYPDGIPSDKEQLPQIAAPERLMLAAGDIVDAQISYSLDVLKRVSTIPPIIDAAKPEPKIIINLPGGPKAVQTICGCSGTGRKGRDKYCSCAMGIELLRIEHRADDAENAHQNEIHQALEEMGV